MGQKTHPTGFRIGVIQPWVSTWFAKVKDYGAFVAEDAKIRKFIKKKLYTAGVSKILIARKAQNTTVTVVTAKPGIVVGRGGQGIEDLKKEGYNIFLDEKYKGDIILCWRKLRILICLIWQKILRK